MPDEPATPRPIPAWSATAWRLRARTAEAAAGLVAARLLIAVVPFGRWRRLLGSSGAPAPAPAAAPSVAASAARKLARHVERAAGRLPFETKCLPRAIALGWMLHRRKIAYTLTIAARPGAARGGEDDLHAWIAVDAFIVLGNLPGPWIPVLVLGSHGR